MPTFTEEEIDKLMISAENKTHGGWGLFIVGVLLFLYLFYGAFINDDTLIDEPLIIVYSSIILMGFGITLIAIGSREKMNILELVVLEEHYETENQIKETNKDKSSEEASIETQEIATKDTKSLKSKKISKGVRIKIDDKTK